MKVTGQFSTTATPAALLGLRDADRLAGVRGLENVKFEAEDRIRATFRARTPLGQVPLATTIVIDAVNDEGARLWVHGRRGAQSVDVELQLAFSAQADGTAVDWSARLQLGGAAASVGQRVAADLARQAITDVLVAAADRA